MIGMIVGVVAGYVSGFVGNALMRFTDLMMAFQRFCSRSYWRRC